MGISKVRLCLLMKGRNCLIFSRVLCFKGYFQEEELNFHERLFQFLVFFVVADY
jgi:hypothetical protein